MEAINKTKLGNKKQRGFVQKVSLPRRLFSHILSSKLARAMLLSLLLISVIVSAEDVRVRNGDLNVTGNLSVDYSTLFVNSINNKIGVGTTDPQNLFNVVGDGNFTGDLYLSIFSCDTLDTDASGKITCGADTDTLPLWGNNAGFLYNGSTTGVAIGKNTANFLLDVNGNISLNNSFVLKDNKMSFGLKNLENLEHDVEIQGNQFVDTIVRIITGGGVSGSSDQNINRSIIWLNENGSKRGGFVYYQADDNDLRLATGNFSLALAEFPQDAISIEAGANIGYVGIGTTDPEELLEVESGSIKLDDPSNNSKFYFGSNKESSIFWNGSNLIIEG
ncbi:MAG: hypothetical protein AABW46_00705 [Nanoarchaeota archaeon]